MTLTHEQFEAYAERLKIEPDKAVREILVEIIVDAYRELSPVRTKDESMPFCEHA